MSDLTMVRRLELTFLQFRKFIITADSRVLASENDTENIYDFVDIGDIFSSLESVMAHANSRQVEMLPAHEPVTAEFMRAANCTGYNYLGNDIWLYRSYDERYYCMNPILAGDSDYWTNAISAYALYTDTAGNPRASVMRHAATFFNAEVAELKLIGRYLYKIRLVDRVKFEPWRFLYFEGEVVKYLQNECESAGNTWLGITYQELFDDRGVERSVRLMRHLGDLCWVVECEESVTNPVEESPLLPSADSEILTENERDFECENCQRMIYPNDVFKVLKWDNIRDTYEKIEVCESCLDNDFLNCDICDKIVDAGYGNETADGIACMVCIEDFTTCDSCNERLPSESVICDDDSDDYFCAGCYSARESADIHPARYQPTTEFFDAEPWQLCHGIELEVGYKAGNKSEYAHKVLQLLNVDSSADYAYLKQDGSIVHANVDDGFEIVTHPASLEFIRSRIKKICDNQVPGLISHDGGNGLGLHISANRKALTNESIARICTFVGADRNSKMLAKMSRRKSNEWSKIIKKDFLADTLDSRGDLIRSGDKYEAVNLQHSSHVEFRLFRGTLKYSSMMLCVEFVNAICCWSLTELEPEHYQSVDSLYEYALKKKKKYQFLVTFLRSQISERDALQK